MPGRVEEANLIARIAELERRLRNLESAPQQPNRSQRGGTFTLIPTDGSPNALLKFGLFTSPAGTAEGVSLYDKNFSTVVAITENTVGLLMPTFSLPTLQEATFQTVTSATFVDLWFTPLRYQAFEALGFKTNVTVGANSAFEARILEAKTGNFTSVASYNNATGSPVGKTVNFGWIPPGVAVGMDQTGEHEPIYRLQVRRTSGANNIDVYVPQFFGGPSFLFVGANSSGNPSVV